MSVLAHPMKTKNLAELRSDAFWESLEQILRDLKARPERTGMFPSFGYKKRTLFAAGGIGGKNITCISRKDRIFMGNNSALNRMKRCGNGVETYG